MRYGKILAFIAGSLVGLTLSLGGLVVAATTLDVEVVPMKFFLNGVDKTQPGGMYYNGKERVPSGFVYNGTPYIPLRLASELFGKDAVWRQEDHSVWVGSQWPGKFIWYTDLQPSDFQSGWEASYCTKENWNNLADVWGNLWNHGYVLRCERWSHATETVRLDGRFEHFTAFLTLHPDARTKIPNNRAPFLKIYLDDKQVYISPSITPTTSTYVPISIDLKGAKTMRFEWDYGNERHSDNTPLGLVEMQFYYNE